MSSAALSRAMTALGKMNLNHAFLHEITKVTGISGAVCYDLTSYSSQSRNIDFLDYGYSESDPDYPQVNVSLVESSESGIPIFYAICSGSVNDITTLKKRFMSSDLQASQMSHSSWTGGCSPPPALGCGTLFYDLPILNGLCQTPVQNRALSILSSLL
jgi:hypothetical protein